MAKHPLLFVQGAGDMWAPDGSGVLANYLENSLGADFDVIAPEMPDADTNPRYGPWRDVVDATLNGIDGAVVLVGHSFGGSVLLKYLAEGVAPASIAGLFLLSVPWWGPGGWGHDEYAPPEDLGSRMPEMPVFLYHSREDPHVPFEHLAFYAKRLPKATSRAIEGGEHSFESGLPVLISDIRETVGV